MNASGSISPRPTRMTRSNSTVTLDRQAVVHRLLGTAVRAIESAATIAILMLISDAILPLFLHSGPHNLVPSPVTPLERGAYWLAYLFTLTQLLIRPRQLFRAAARNPFVIGVLLIAAMSFAWSIDPATTIRRTFAFGMWTLFGLYLASRYDAKELLQLLGIALGLLALMSLASGILVPDYGRESGFDSGAWRGVFSTKNTLGEMMLLAAVVFGIFASRPGRARIPAILGLMLAVPLIALAKATAALLIAGVLTITIPVVLAFRRNNAAAALVLACLLGLSAAASISVAKEDAVLSMLGKDATLTGRTVLWANIAQRIEERPILGYGYGAFWAPTGTESERVRTAIGWDTPHSHNGLLDMWLDFGLVGVLVLLAAYLLAIRRAWWALRRSIEVEGVWAMSFLVMLFLGNTTESSITQSLLIWVVFVAVACMRWTRAPVTRKPRRA
jgi:exopolysaccharide production protein ExoQ